MSSKNTRLPRLLGNIHLGLGIVLFLAYWAYLPMPENFMVGDAPDPGMILYALATAGGAFVAWGWVLRGMISDQLSRARVMHASAAGFALLGLMRLGTALFPHGPFAQMVALPAIECVVFLLLAVVLYRSA